MYWSQVRGTSLEFGFGRGIPEFGVERVRGRVSLETDEQSHMGRDVLIAAPLVAKRFGFETTPLTTMGKSLRVFLSTSRIFS